MTRTLPVDRSITFPSRMFLDMETRGGMNVALSYVLVLDEPLTAEEVRTAIESLTAVSPRLRQRIASGGEQWVPTAAGGQVDFVELAPDTDMGVVYDHCSRLQERVFPLDRPLWHVVYFSPLRGGGSALLVRLHHAVGNGAEALTMLASAFGVDVQATRWVDVVQDTDVLQEISAPEPPAVVRHLISAGDGAGSADAALDLRRQEVALLEAGAREIWDAVAARHGVSLDVESISLIADAMFRYRERAGTSRDSILFTLPTTSDKLYDLSNGALGVHVPNIRVGADVIGTDRLPALAKLLAAEIAASEQKAMEMLRGAAPAAPATATSGPADAEISDVLLTSLVTMPALEVQGHRVVDFSGFAPVTGTRVVASPMDYGGEVRVCLNMDAALVSSSAFRFCAHQALSDLFGAPQAT